MGGFHSISHHGDEPVRRAQYEKIITWHIEQVAYFLNKLKSLDEGGTSLLDNSMVMLGGSSNAETGTWSRIFRSPSRAAGKGTLRPGRRVRAAEKTPLCNLYVSMLQRMGIPEKAFGDSAGALGGLS